MLGKEEYSKWAHSPKRPLDIPSSPSKTYQKKWIGWGDWLGTGTIAPQTIHKNYLPFKEAKEKVRELAKQHNLKDSKDWSEFVKTGKKPDIVLKQPSSKLLVIESKDAKKKDKLDGSYGNKSFIQQLIDYGEENLIKIKLISEPDSGALDGFSRVLSRINGEFFGSCLCDEEMMPGAISWGVENLRKYPDLAAVYGDIYTTDIEGNITGRVTGPK
ncbi:hypothetical protein IIB79_08220, partial [candidate division KSB1 bacterium]|nr:hypothetical protein [candidate division KSB1 bacterium]